MCAQPLRRYFETDHHQRRALAACDLFLPEELDLYDASWDAFDPSSSAAASFRHFEKIYDELAHNRPPSYWNVFRPNSLADCWQPQQIFDTIKQQFAEFSWRGPINLLNFPKMVSLPHLESCLAKMRCHYCPAKISEGRPNPFKISMIMHGRSENDLN